MWMQFGEKREKKVIGGRVGVRVKMISRCLYYSMKNIMLIMSGWHM